MENDFRSLLTGDTAVAALVGERIYPATYPQGAADPCVRIRKVSGSPGLHMQGSDGLSSELVQIDVRASIAADVYAVRDAIVARLHAFAGVEGATDFRVIYLQSDRGLDFESTDPVNYYTASMDFAVWSRAAAAS